MDKGIRQGVSVKFNDMLSQLAELGGKKFRRIILDWTVAEYGCTMAAASTHYNHAFQAVKKATPEKVVGLGRPEGKNNGGRKKKAAAEAAPAAATDGAANAAAAVITDAAQAAALEGLAANVNPQEGNDQAPGTDELPKTYTVKTKKDGKVVAEGISLEAANELIEKAKAAKKGTLVLAD